jgi:hypothetical protein
MSRISRSRSCYSAPSLDLVSSEAGTAGTLKAGICSTSIRFGLHYRYARRCVPAVLQRRVYGTVKHVDIKSPELSDALRDALNKKVLDGLPLTKPFDQTPLAGLRDALAHGFDGPLTKRRMSCSRLQTIAHT